MRSRLTWFTTLLVTAAFVASIGLVGAQMDPNRAAGMTRSSSGMGKTRQSSTTTATRRSKTSTRSMRKNVNSMQMGMRSGTRSMQRSKRSTKKMHSRMRTTPVMHRSRMHRSRSRYQQASYRGRGMYGTYRMRAARYSMKDPRMPQFVINGRPMSTENAIWRNGQWYVPLRATFEAMGGSVSWNPQMNEVAAESGGGFQQQARLPGNTPDTYKNTPGTMPNTNPEMTPATPTTPETTPTTPGAPNTPTTPGTPTTPATPDNNPTMPDEMP
jgi:hypothetical protein